MLAIDWSHTKNLTVYDGKKVSVIDRRSLLKWLAGESSLGVKSKVKFKPASRGVGDESMMAVKSRLCLQSSTPTIVLEQGCPISLIYDILKTGYQVSTISNRATQDYRVEHNIEKTDENDARIIYELANNGAKLETVNFDDEFIQLHSLYNQYCRYQKARVAMQNMRKGYLRHFGDGESMISVKSINDLHPSSDVVPYDMAIDTFKAKEHSLLQKLIPLVAGGESSKAVQSMQYLQPPAIKGLGSRIWAGLIVTANPVYFKCLSAYLRFCGLTEDAIKSHKYNRHARMLYRMLAEEVMKQRDPIFRPIYDKCKADIAENHSDYTKLHIHNAALNRTATMLSKTIFQYCNELGGESTGLISL